MQDWVNIFEAIRKQQEVKIPAQLHLKNQINDICEALGGVEATYDYFKRVMDAEPAEIKTI